MLSNTTVLVTQIKDYIIIIVISYTDVFNTSGIWLTLCIYIIV